MPPGNWLKLSSSSACSMRVPILVEREICSSVILRFSRSSFSLSPKEGKPGSRFRRTDFTLSRSKVIGHSALSDKLADDVESCRELQIPPLRLSLRVGMTKLK